MRLLSSDSLGRRSVDATLLPEMLSHRLDRGFYARSLRIAEYFG
jgi:hypothetical protein